MPPDTLTRVKSIIAISSCKGGVGKSTIAAHLSHQLAQRGFRVGLADVDIYGPSIPTLFNIANAQVYTNDQKQLVPIEKDKLKIMSFGFLLGDGPAVLRGPMVTQYVQQVLHNTDWGDLDYLFIDMPPGTGDIQLTITQSVRLGGAVIITTPQTLSLIDVARGILMFEKVNVPILGVIENMSYFICDQCDKKHAIFGSPSSKTLEERFGVKTLAELPLLPELTQKIEKPSSHPLIIEAVEKAVRALGGRGTQQTEIPDIEFDTDYVTFTWANQDSLKVKNRDLRLSCRCAVCINELTGEKILKDRDVKPDIAPKEVTPLGNYAIGVVWNDGHSSGIYPYDNIRQLALT